MGLVYFILNNDRNHLNGFIHDVKDILEFFKPIIKEINRTIEEYINLKPGCSWNAKEYKYDIRVLFGGLQKSLDGILFQLLDNYVKKNIDDWIQQFSNKEWFEYSNDTYYAAQGICYFISRIFIRLQSSEDLDTSINREIDMVFEIKNPLMKRYQKVLIQNLVLAEDQVLNFRDQTLVVNGREERWHEGKDAMSCIIKDFNLKFQICLRRITPYEFDQLTFSRGLLADQMNISTCLEIIYEFPNDRFSPPLSELTFKSHLATYSVQAFLDNIIDKVIMAIKFSSGQYIFPVHLRPKPQNFYLQKFFSESITIRHKNWMYSFFTGKCLINPQRFKIIQEIFDILLKCEGFPIAKQVLTIMRRADSAMNYELLLTSLTMYWIIMEAILSVRPKALIAKQVSWLDSNRKKYLEREFWELVYDIRNNYMHGELWDKIEDKIKKKHQDKNIQWFVLITREKAMRVLLFLFLLRESSDPSDDLFKNPKYFRDPPTLSNDVKNKFKQWIQLGKENELGKPEKYKVGIGLKPFSV